MTMKKDGIAEQAIAKRRAQGGWAVEAEELLNNPAFLSPREFEFLHNIAAQCYPPTPRQRQWMDDIARRDEEFLATHFRDGVPACMEPIQARKAMRPDQMRKARAQALADPNSNVVDIAARRIADGARAV
jgi:hypothetical protein